MKNKKGLIIIICCAVLVIGTVIGVAISTSKKNNAGFGGPGFGAQQQTSAVSVKTQVAKKTTLHDYVNTNGEIETQSSIQVFPDIGGKIVDVKVSLGSNVKRGDIIAEIDPSSPGAQYAHSPVYAPISGTITTSPLKSGATVSTASSITTIGDVANLQVTANIPERYVAALKIGLKANIVLEAYPNVVFTATVSRVSPVVDSSSRTKEVILNFDKNDYRINAGMFAKVTLYTSDYSDAVTVPEDCIVEKSNKKYVYVVNADCSTVSEREITTGNTVDKEVQLLTGVSDGETVVVEGMRVLTDGSMINDITKGNKSAEKSESSTDEKSANKTEETK